MTKTSYQLKELSIELSNRCLLRCIHCSSGSTPKAYPNELHPPEVLRLMKEARELGATVLTLSGGDPVLIDPDLLMDCIGAADAMGYEEILFYTTGIRSVVENPALCADHVGMFPVAYTFDKYKEHLVFVFSLHSYKAEVHDYIMGRPGVWRMTMRSIHECISVGFKVHVQMVPMLPNWQDAPGLLELCDELGVGKMSMLRFVPQTRGAVNNRRLMLNVREFAGMQRMMYVMLNDASIVNTRLRLGCPIDFQHTVLPQVFDKISPCHAGTDLILVRPQGDVHPCAAWKTLPETDNVRDNSLAHIWEKGKVFEALRRYREVGWMDIAGVCASCGYQPSCKSGCPAQRMHALKVRFGVRPESCIKDLYVDAPDPLCPVGNHREGTY